MSQQGLKQASVRAVTGSAESWEGDWHRLFNISSLPIGNWNERMLRWVNLKLTATYTNLPEALQALATSNGAFNWSSLGTFSATIGGGVPAMKFNVATNSQYVPLISSVT